MAKNLTEDAVRDLARDILGLVDSDAARAGVGQLTTFNQLGFAGVADKPDGWYLPKNKADVALVLETKATRIALGKAQVDEVLKNVRIVQTQYEKVIGVLYNGEDVRVFKGEEEVKTPDKLQHVGYYLSLYTVDSIDKERIYQLTARINNCLHFEFGIKNLYHRMIFTACALVAERYGAGLKRLKNLGYATFHTAIHSTLSKSLEDSRKQNAKIDILLEEYSDIKMNTTDNQKAINDFIDWVIEISECVNSNEWRGEDVMGIFFNEFNRYKKKSESGQIFTPEHITDFMYKILEVNMDDCVLDATCGSGGFLVKAMANMIREAGGMETKKAREIKSKQLYMSAVMRESETSLESLRQTDGEKHALSVSGWQEFIIGDLFEKLQLDVKKEDFNKTFDVSEERTKEFNLPLVNAKHGNNGIMYYGREADFETAEMTIDIVQNGAIATGDVYAQPQRTGALWDAYLVKPKAKIDSAFTLMFLATVLEKAIKDKFSYDDKCVWDKAKLLTVTLPCTSDNEPDWAYMDEYMRTVMECTKSDLLAIQSIN